MADNDGKYTVGIIGNTFVQRVDMGIGTTISEVTAALTAETKAGAERVTVLRMLLAHISDTRSEVNLSGPLLWVDKDVTPRENERVVVPPPKAPKRGRPDG